jgi:hypothetical protein
LPNDAVITEVIEKVQNQAEPEKIVASLFRDLDLPRVRRISSLAKPKTEDD